MLNQTEMVLKSLGFAGVFLQAAALTEVQGLMGYFDNIGTILILILAVRYFINQANKKDEAHEKTVESIRQEMLKMTSDHLAALEAKSTSYMERFREQEERHKEAIKEIESRHTAAIQSQREHYTQMLNTQRELFSNNQD